MSQLFERLAKDKIVAIIRGIQRDEGVATARALADGGIVFVEVTMNTDGATDMISQIREELGDRLEVGAGTVLNLDMAKEAIAAGAQYLISPNVNEAVISYGLEQGVDVWPGAMTPTEIVNAHAAGATAVKVFPMGTLGSQYLKEIRGPLSHIPMLATGGVHLDNMIEFFEAGAIAVGLGGNLVNKQMIAAGNFEQLKINAHSYVQKLNEL